MITLKYLHWGMKQKEGEIHPCVQSDATFKLLAPRRSFLSWQQVQRTVGSRGFLLHVFEGWIHVLGYRK